MPSAATLSIDARKWTETIKAAGADCLCSAVSAKNVTHVLSTATVRAPQKQLCAAVSDFVPAMLENTHGVSILTALVRYGTTATVEQIASKLTPAEEGVWSFTAAPKKEMTKCLSHLLERLVYREDCTGESHNALLGRLKAVKKKSLMTSSFTLPATARLALVDDAFAAGLLSSGEAQKALGRSCQHAATAASAEEFCRTLLERPKDNAASDFVWKALAASMKADAKAHPREAILALLAAHGPVQLVNRMADAMAQWSTVRELCTLDSYAHIIAHLLERCDDERAGNRLVAAVITQEADVTERMGARKAAQQHLLAALAAKSSYAQTLERRLGTSQTKRLAAAKVRFANATQSKATTTQQAILEKLKKLHSTTKSSLVAGTKRARE
ncbi:conserved hypothetical protein [Leishmania major strain Friedlin]|uniref:Uncharacterized protein n=1 Tax=Leishmania major TaxID=5664 RepID=E9ACV6_LEIMA|nr:conserved hypothetical protein [Leishmania major strain Friedlin]CAG9576852.1 hypothetical_protein_-_conserved [Leishmania major strain Friedlin]CBZ12309.1 conserved hypothetical protein [Leishmania major strain Friedlin]|eukprot:XP_003722048.1 conserved hypothetical protein [Leishmania major strain Friedlin]